MLTLPSSQHRAVETDEELCSRSYGSSHFAALNKNLVTRLPLLNELASETDRKLDQLITNPPATAEACFSAIRDLTAHLKKIKERLTPWGYGELGSHIERATVLLRAAELQLNHVPREMHASPLFRAKLGTYLAETMSLADRGAHAAYEDLTDHGLEGARDYRIPPEEMVVPTDLIQFDLYMAGLKQQIKSARHFDDGTLKSAFKTLSAAFEKARQKKNPDALGVLQENFKALCIKLGEAQRQGSDQGRPSMPPPLPQPPVDRAVRDEMIAQRRDLAQRTLAALERRGIGPI